MDSEKEIALYYPHIDICDAGLIKTSALYWDELWTIVPESEREPYKSPFSQEASRLAFLKPRIVHPEDGIVRRIGEEFSNDIQTEAIKKRVIGLIKNNKRKEFAKLHFDKWALGPLMSIWFALNEEGIPLSPIDWNYLMFPAPIGDTYMSRLASAIAVNDNTVPLTNLSSFHDVMLDRFLDYSQERKENQAQLAKLSLEMLAINPQVPLIEVLRFRDTHYEDLLKYRCYIRRLVRHISKGLDISEKQSLFEEIVKDDILAEKTEIESKLQSEAKLFLLSNLVIALVGIGTILLNGQKWLSSLLPTGTNLGLNLYRNIRAERIIKDKPIGYLYQAQKKFGVDK